MSSLARILFGKMPPEDVLQDWTKCYGTFFSFRLGTQTFLVISDHDLAHELLVVQSAKSSSRREAYVTSKELWDNLGVLNTTNNDIWNRHRRIVQQALTSKKVAASKLVIEHRIRELILDLETLPGVTAKLAVS